MFSSTQGSRSSRGIDSVLDLDRTVETVRRERLLRQHRQVGGEVPHPEDRQLPRARRQGRDRFQVVQRGAKVPSCLAHDGGHSPGRARSFPER